MNTLRQLYHDHLKTLQQQAQTILTKSQRDALLIHSGELLTVFQDDRTYPFKVNPLFKAWLPVTQTPHCWLWIDGVSRPKLFFYAPNDYWHKVNPLPDSYWSEEFDVIPLANVNDIATLLPPSRQNVVYLGPTAIRAEQLGITADNINPTALIHFLHYQRSFKSDYELYCLREAQKNAVHGHRVARDSFYAGESEFTINQHFLAATGQHDTTVPYGNIVALNHHAAILHYTELERQRPARPYSFLFDAGAEFQGYAADITRTYAWDTTSAFDELISAVNQQQQELIASLKVGNRYSDYHLQMNQRLAKVLCETGLMKNISAEALVAENITSTFMPHGVGHLLGLQVHDVAGFMQDEQGTHLAAPATYPWLRCTRVLAERMVLTIEPGCYFIESLLAKWRSSSLSHHFNWQAIDAFKVYGGIRIEDNIVMTSDGLENLTRDLQLA